MATDSFLKRWSERKLSNDEIDNEIIDEAPSNNESNEEYGLKAEEHVTKEALNEDDNGDAVGEEHVVELSLDDVENLKSDDSVSAFLAAGVSSQVKKAALRKIFSGTAYNEIDGLLDYDQDFSSTPDLAADAANGLRKWVKEQFDDEDDRDKDKEGVTDSPQKTEASETVEPEDDNANSTPNQDDNEAYTEIETKSTHGQIKDNLSYGEGQNVPVQGKDENSDGF